MTTWLAWYRFAREKLDYSHNEAVVYANVRVVEEQNLQALREKRVVC